MVPNNYYLYLATKPITTFLKRPFSALFNKLTLSVIMGETKVVDVGMMKAGSFIVLDGAACRVQDATVSKSGKHGHAKFRIVAIGMLDEKKRDVVMPSGSMVESPIIDKRAAQVLSVTGAGDMANIMDTESFETLDLKIPDELKGQVHEGITVIYWIILNDKVMKQIKSE